MNGRLRVVVALAAVLTNCASARPYAQTNYTIGAPMSATVGSEMVVLETGTRDDLNNTNVTARQELLYGGVAGNVIRVAYREYATAPGTALLARPAFTQELQYDISQSRTIAFRRLRLEVLSAANDEIRFKVVDGFRSEELEERLAPKKQGSRCRQSADCASDALQCREGVCARWSASAQRWIAE